MQIQIGASLLVIGFGIFRFVNRRHPRVLARIRPTQLGFWSFAVAIAHGAGLMLVPIYLGLCQAADLDEGHEAAGALINANRYPCSVRAEVLKQETADVPIEPCVASTCCPPSWHVRFTSNRVQTLAPQRIDAECKLRPNAPQQQIASAIR